MAKVKRSPFERENDLIRVTDLYLKQWRQIDIARELGITQQQVSYDIKEVRNRWLKAQLHNMNELKMRELDRIDSLEREYWMAWERSKGRDLSDLPSLNPKPPKRKKGQRNDVVSQVEEVLEEIELADKEADKKLASEKRTAIVNVNDPFGDPRYLAGIQWCINRRLVLLGIDTGAKTVDKATSTEPLSEEQRTSRVTALLNKAKQRAKQNGG